MRKTNMKAMVVAAMTMLACTLMASSIQAAPTKVPESIKTPDVVESRIGTLRFKDGYPVGDTATTVRDELDYLHGVEAFMNSIHGVSLYALRKGALKWQ